jgi:hypothetical protein
MWPEVVWERGALILYEARPASRGKTPIRTPIARFRCTTRGWSLDCMRSDLRWHDYGIRGPTPTIAPHLNDLDEDVTGIFWG